MEVRTGGSRREKGAAGGSFVVGGEKVAGQVEVWWLTGRRAAERTLWYTKTQQVVAACGSAGQFAQNREGRR